MWYLIYMLLGLTALGLYTKKGKNVIKFLQIFIETLRNNKVKVITELNPINSSPVIKYGDLYLNACNTFHYYDVLCFTSGSIEDKEKHNYNPIHEICEKIPINLVRLGACLASIPFRPYDFNYSKLYVGVKKISQETYSVYRFDQYN